LGATSQQITDARSALIEAKETLGSKRADLVQLWTRDQMLEEMLELLDQMCCTFCPFHRSIFSQPAGSVSDHLKIVPDLLETLMSEKRLLQASVLLVRSLKLINKPDMLEIGAVSDLRSYLVGQETVSLCA
jgi:exocyst complex component 4